VRSIGRDTALQAREQLVQVAKHLLQIEIGVFVLRDAGRGFQQREMLIALHQGAEILQRARCGEVKHALFLMDAPPPVKPCLSRLRVSA
jgi:hypothetical protein